MSDYRPDLEGQEQIAGVQGVFVIVPAEDVEKVHNLFQRWFGGRDEVAVVGYGDMDKDADLGYVMVEWYGFAIDRLFLTILDQDDPIDCHNYATYVRGE
jgi:hypothetical protein